MKAVILAGGLGTRLSEETRSRPKPMVDIGGRPMLWHIMKTYQRHGVAEFVVCLGKNGDFIKQYVLHYRSHVSDVVVDLASGVECEATRSSLGASPLPIPASKRRPAVG